LLVVAVTFLAPTACSGGPSVPPADPGMSAVQPADGAANAAGGLVGKETLRIAVKIDQPGLGEIVNNDPSDRRGLDIDIANYVARELGAKRVEWHDVVSRDREKVLQNGTVDLVVASYVMNENRIDLISFAGPYLEVGHDILIRSSDAGTITDVRSLRNKKVCTVAGATSADHLRRIFGTAWDTPAHLVRMAGNGQCAEAVRTGKVDADVTLNAILAGYAAQHPNELRLLNRPFTSEQLGIGLAKADERDVVVINRILRKMIQDGTWAASVRKNLGAAARLFLADPPVPVP
jgi:glutamate transport system substrate-binding protein